MKLISRLINCIIYCSAAALLLTYFAPYVSSIKFWPLIFFGIAYPWLLVLNICLLLFSFLLKRKILFIPLFSILIGCGYFKTFFGFNWGKTKPTYDSKIISYNVNSFYGHDWKSNFWTKKTNPILEFVKKENVDFLCFQELFNGPTINKYIENYELFPHDNFENEIFYQASKTRFLDQGFIAKSESNGVTWFDIKLNGKIIRFYNVHLKSNFISLQTHEFDMKEDFFSKAIFDYSYHVVKNLKTNSQIRVRQAEELAAHISECPYPVIVCGDFNEVPLSYPYRIISKGLKDAFHEKGRGFGFTYAGKIPGLRLDYVLVSPEIEIVDLRIRKDKLSDHYPLIAYLKIK